MKVSVIMPTYNRLELMKRAIDSFLKQDYKNSELIILENGCSDGTKEYLKGFDLFHNIKVINREVNTPLGALNILWNAAEGDLICQLHDDDELTKDSLSNRVKLFQQDEFLEVCYGGWVNQTIDGKVLAKYEAQSSNPALIVNKEYINFTTMMWKNSIKQKFMFDEDLVFQVDAHFKIRCAMECTMTAVRDSVMLYSVHSNQETYRARRENKLDAENVLMRKKLNSLYGKLF